MCLVGPSEACDRYEHDEEYARRSGNLCWGMGATTPCKNCGQESFYHSPRALWPEVFSDELARWEEENYGNGSD